MTLVKKEDKNVTFSKLSCVYGNVGMPISMSVPVRNDPKTHNTRILAAKIKTQAVRKLELGVK